MIPTFATIVSIGEVEQALIPRPVPRPRAGNLVALPVSPAAIMRAAEVVVMNAPRGRMPALNRIAEMFAARRAAAGWPGELVETAAAEYRLQVLGAALDLLIEETRR